MLVLELVPVQVRVPGPVARETQNLAVNVEFWLVFVLFFCLYQGGGCFGAWRFGQPPLFKHQDIPLLSGRTASGSGDRELRLSEAEGNAELAAVLQEAMEQDGQLGSSEWCVRVVRTFILGRSFFFFFFSCRLSS